MIKNTEFAPLLIKRVDAFGVRLPLIKPMLMSGIEIRHSDNLLVRIESDSGLVGWGEAPAALSHGGASLQDMVGIFNTEFAPFLLRKNALDLSGITSALFKIAKKGKSTVGAVDIALYDLVGQYLGVPTYMLIGGMRRDTVAPLWLIGTQSVKTDIEEAKIRYDQGYRFFKIKLGVKSLEEDIESTLALRSTLGGEVRLCGDANTGYTCKEAIDFSEAVAPAAFEFLEQPLAKDDLNGLRQLIKLNIVRVGLDESITSTQDILQYAAENISGVSLKTLKLGGISGVIAAGNICESLNMQINLSGKIAETSIASAALLQLSAVLNNVNWGVSPSHPYLAEDVVKNSPTPKNGAYTISKTSGLGIEVDELAVKRLLI